MSENTVLSCHEGSFVEICESAPERLCQVLKKRPLLKKLLIVSDENVFPLFGKSISQLLEQNGYNVFAFILKAGEEEKNCDNAKSILSFASSKGFCREDAFIALGGGVVGDITGFCASVYMRGISFYQLPTTLLAMADSSYGGKNAINFEGKKNIIGTFYQSSATLIDTSFLDTLSESELQNGMSEIIKCGFIGDNELLELLDKDTVCYKKLLEHAISLKIDIVNKDEKDLSLRHLLNFGHTVGHAIESLSDFTVSHGHAVALGMVAITKMAVNNNYCQKETLELLTKLLKKYSLPICCQYEIKDIIKEIHNDKKMEGDKIALVIPTKIGKCEIFKFDYNKLYGLF